MRSTIRPEMKRDDAAATADTLLSNNTNAMTKTKVGTIDVRNSAKSENGGNCKVLSSAIMASVHPLKQQGHPEWTLQQQTKHKQLMTDSDGSPQLRSMGGRGGARAKEERDAKMPAGMLMERESYSSDEESGGNLHLGNFGSVTAAAYGAGTADAKVGTGTMLADDTDDAEDLDWEWLRKENPDAYKFFRDGKKETNKILKKCKLQRQHLDALEAVRKIPLEDFSSSSEKSDGMPTDTLASANASGGILANDTKKDEEAAASTEGAQYSNVIRATTYIGGTQLVDDTPSEEGGLPFAASAAKPTKKPSSNESVSIDYSTACANAKREKERRTVSKAPTKYPNRALTAATFAGGVAGVGTDGKEDHPLVSSATGTGARIRFQENADPFGGTQKKPSATPSAGAGDDVPFGPGLDPSDGWMLDGDSNGADLPHSIPSNGTGFGHNDIDGAAFGILRGTTARPTVHFRKDMLIAEKEPITTPFVGNRGGKSRGSGQPRPCLSEQQLMAHDDVGSVANEESSGQRPFQAPALPRTIRVPNASAVFEPSGTAAADLSLKTPSRQTSSRHMMPTGRGGVRSGGHDNSGIPSTIRSFRSNGSDMTTLHCQAMHQTYEAEVEGHRDVRRENDLYYDKRE